MIKTVIFLLFLCAGAPVWAQMSVPTRPKPALATPRETPAEDYAIKRPGEITFTTGVTIEGRIEKPQVVLVLSKEKIKLNPVEFRHDLLGNVTRPLNVVPFELFSEKTEKEGKKGL